MTRILVVLIAATTFVYWLVSRKVAQHSDRDRSELDQNTQDIFEDQVLEVESPSDRSILETQEEYVRNEVLDPKKEHEPAIETISDGPSQKEPDVSAGASAEHHSSDGDRATELVPKDEQSPVANSDPLLPLLSTEACPEPEIPAASIGIPATNGEYPSEKPVATASSNAAGDNRLHAEQEVREPEAAQTGDPPTNDGAAQKYVSNEAVEPPQRTGVPVGTCTERPPLHYRPPPQKPSRQVSTRPVDQDVKGVGPSGMNLEIRVRLTFDRFGFCAVGLLPVRTEEIDNEVDVKSRGISLRLVSQEDWYQDLLFDNIGDLLRQGLELKGLLAEQRPARWLLTGRNVYVLASHPRASGFVSTPRLTLGRSHVVLCVVEQLHQVEATLNEAGCQKYTKLDQSHGVPTGWVGLRGVSPTKAIPLELGSDPFYAIKPAPDIDIELEGGVRLRNSVWLKGYPPQIKLLGESNGAVKILIDGKEAQQTVEGSLVVDGYDISGEHSVYCHGLSCSRSYSIEDPPDSWQQWPAYHFDQADICGPLVLPTAEAASGPAFTVPMTNPLLLGAEPGQIFWCSQRKVVHWKGFVPFDVVWALPAQPLICDKKTARILQFADTPVRTSKTRVNSGLSWCNAILDASRKGLQIENGSANSTARWREYKKVARDIRRGRR
jgi:hypothetical protein